MQWYYSIMLKCELHIKFLIRFSCNTLATCTEGSVRLLAGSDYDYYDGVLDAEFDNLYIKDTLSQGRVQICIGGRYTKVCDDSWDDRDATVVCSQLGFSPYGELRTVYVFYTLYNHFRNSMSDIQVRV